MSPNLDNSSHLQIASILPSYKGVRRGSLPKPRLDRSSCSNVILWKQWRHSIILGAGKKSMQSPDDDSPYGQEHSVGHTPWVVLRSAWQLFAVDIYLENKSNWLEAMEGILYKTFFKVQLCGLRTSIYVYKEFNSSVKHDGQIVIFGVQVRQCKENRYPAHEVNSGSRWVRMTRSCADRIKEKKTEMKDD